MSIITDSQSARFL